MQFRPSNQLFQCIYCYSNLYQLLWLWFTCLFQIEINDINDKLLGSSNASTLSSTFAFVSALRMIGTPCARKYNACPASPSNVAQCSFRLIFHIFFRCIDFHICLVENVQLNKFDSLNSAHFIAFHWIQQTAYLQLKWFNLANYRSTIKNT